MSDRRTFLCMLVAVALLVFIVFSGIRLAALWDSEAALGNAGNESEDGLSLAALAGLDTARLSGGQVRRRDERFREILERRLRSRPPLAMIGSQPYDACRREPWRFSAGTNRVTVTATLDPPELGRWVKTLTVGSAETAAFAGSPPAADVQVPLPGAGRQKEMAIAFGVSLPGGGTATVTLPESLVLHQDDRKPRISGGGTLAEGDAIVTSTVPSGEGFSIDVQDEAGLVLVSWVIDGKEQEERIPRSPAIRSRSLALPEGFTNSDRRRVSEISVRAENASGNRAAATFRLDIRPKNWHPVQRLLVNGAPIDRARTPIVRGPRARLLLEIESGLQGEVQDLGLRVDGREYRPASAEGGLEAEVELSADKPSGILLVRGSSVLDHWTVQADAEPPGVAVFDAGGTACPPGKVVLLAGTGIRLEIIDPGGVIEGEQAIRSEGLVRGRSDIAPHRLDLAFRLPARGLASLRVKARDRLGNESPDLIWDITAEETLSLTKVLLDGRLPGGGRMPTRKTSAILEIQGTPRGKLDVLLCFSGEPSIALRTDRVVLGEDGSARVEIDLAAGASAEHDRILRLRGEAGDDLAEFEVRIDAQPPKLAVRGLDPDPREAGTFEGMPGAEYEIAATDDDAVAEIEVVGGGAGEPRMTEGGMVRATRVPESLPAVVRARAVDAAGNERTLEFRILPPPSPPVPTPGAGGSAAGLSPVPPPESDRLPVRNQSALPPVPENLPATLPNPAGGQELVLVRPAPGGPGFRPFYMGKTEVTVGMFTTFLNERGDDEAFWAETLKGLRNPAGGSPEPREVRVRAGRLLDIRLRRERPLTGATPDIAHVFLTWFGEKLGGAGGMAALPTLQEWLLAAGRAEFPDAIYPTTGASRDGKKLLDRSCAGTLGGAAIGGSQTSELPEAGSYAAGAFGLYDMAGSAWEWVLGPDDRPMAIGGGLPSSQEECRLDAPLKSVTPQQRGYVGIRIVVRP